MAVHFIHVSKAGGTALRHAIRVARVNAGGSLPTPWGEVWGHDHRFRFENVEDDDFVVIPLRDPVSRFVSGFYSRLRRGAPRFSIEWTRGERQAFEWFPTPQALADALSEPSGELRQRAEVAMKSIAHVNRPMTRWTGKPDYVRKRLGNVLYVARQETLAADWEALKELLDLPRDLMLPEDDLLAHRTVYTAEDDRAISERGTIALREWYAEDCELLDLGEEFRQRGTRPPPGDGDQAAERRGLLRLIRR
jgi:hypothetical protein